MKWRKTLFVLHRDVGFFCLGLTMIYAVSGIAVNHREHWDYNYSFRQESVVIGDPATLLGMESTEAPGTLARTKQDELVDAISRALERRDPPKKVFWRGPRRLSLFYRSGDRDVVDYLPERGLAELERKRPRFLIREFNFLHLNEGRSLWTYVADVFAVMLTFLAVSGVVMSRGRHGILGRGGVLARLGVLLPGIAYWLLT